MLTAAIILFVSSGCAATGYTVYPETAVFSDDIMFSAKIIGGRSGKAFERMTEVISNIDGQVSQTKPDSDVARVNAAGALEPVEVGEYTYELFNLALGYFALTDGAFNCAASPLSDLWHVDAASIAVYRPDADGTHISPELPTIEQVLQTLEFCDPRTVTASSENGKYYLTKSDGRTKLDFGGIAKGYAVDKCVGILDEYGISSALIDISGNAYFYGRYASGDGAWNVGIASPRPRAALFRGYVCAISVNGGTSAVTSGDYMRYYVHDSYDESVYVTHIIGRDGVPIGVENNRGEWKNSDEWVISATVLGESSALCDALSTAVSALGIETGGRLLQKVGCKGLIFTEKRYTIIGDVALYKQDKYDGYCAYEYHEL